MMKEQDRALWFRFVLKVDFSQVSWCARSLVLHPVVLLIRRFLLSAVPQSFPESVLDQLAVALQHGLPRRKLPLQLEHRPRERWRHWSYWISELFRIMHNYYWKWILSNKYHYKRTILYLPLKFTIRIQKEIEGWFPRHGLNLILG